MATDSRKRLALAVVDFLQTSLKDGTLQPEDADSIEIATNCIAECFHVDPNDATAMKDALDGQNLLSIYGVYEKLKGKNNTTAAAGPESVPTVESTVPQSGEKASLSSAPTEESEKFKGIGNAAMQKKDYQSAVDNYTKALEICPLNTIYLSNRAAAYSALNQHELAKNDAELATATDPKYTKAWSRLGLARYALGDAKGAAEAYQQGIDAEGNGGSEAMKKGLETARRKAQQEERSGLDGDEDAGLGRNASEAGGMPGLGGLASMLGGGGGGGLPDLGSLMQNPMMRQMAQNLMSNPEMMNNIMNNPQLRGMANQFGGGGGGAAGAQGGQGGGMPNLSEMMNDPALRQMAQQFMGGMGGGGGAGRGAGGNAPQ